MRQYAQSSHAASAESILIPQPLFISTSLRRVLSVTNEHADKSTNQSAQFSHRGSYKRAVGIVHEAVPTVSNQKAVQ
jgi:hypothetical protein